MNAPVTAPQSATLVENDTDPAVGILATVVAAGTSGDHKLKATLLLAPIPTAHVGARPTVPLRLWPDRIFGMLLGDDGAGSTIPVALEYAAFPADGSSCTPGTSAAADVKVTVVNIARTFSGPSGADDLADVGALWRQTFDPPSKNPPPPGGPSRWQTLADALATSFDSGNIRAGDIGGDASTQADSGTQPSVRSVLSVQHGDLALTLEMMRARELAATVREAFGEDGVRQAMAKDIVSVLPPSPVDAKITADGAKAALEKKQWDERDAARRNLTDASEKAKTAYADAWNAFIATRCAPPPVIPVSGDRSTDLASKNAADLQQAMTKPLASHSYGSTFQEPLDDQEYDDTAAEAAGRRFFTLQSTPSLARLFGLTVDIEIESSETLKDGYYFLSTAFGRAAAGISDPAEVPYPTTIAKLCDGGAHFWPATRAELNAGVGAVLGPEHYTLYKGVAVLGQGWASNAKDRRPRYEITSIDVRSAAETRQHLINQLTADRDDQVENKQAEELPVNDARATMRTGGLTLVDRGRQATEAWRLAIAEAQHKAPPLPDNRVVLDADELTEGYRLDVAVYKGAATGYEWRSLMHRVVDFGTSGVSGPTVSRVLANLVGAPRSADRMEIDSASLAMPTRILPVALETVNKTDPKNVDAIVEEAVAIWDGGPMAVDATGTETDKLTPDDLPFGRTIDLPHADPKKPGADAALTPPRLRFGWPYRVGMRAVFMGGASVPLSEAKSFYEKELNGALAFPPRAGGGEPPATESLAAEQRRILRHERIDAPTLLIPHNIAVTALGEMGFERAPEAIVRKYVGVDDDASTDKNAIAATPLSASEQAAHDRARPSETSRIFVVSCVSQAFADLHGAFDHVTGVTIPEGLAGMRYDAPKGGFPVALPDKGVGMDQIPFERSRTVTAGAAADAGDAVFATYAVKNAKPFARAVPYCADPMAESYVLALRYAGSTTYLPGQPLVVPAYRTSNDHRIENVLPLRVVVTTAKKRDRGSVTTQQDVMSFVKDAVVLFDPTSGVDPKLPGRPIPVRQVTVKLAPGEDYELDVWCAPSAEALARNFAVIETLGALAVHDAPEPADDEAFLSGLAPLIGQDAADVARAELAAHPGTGVTGFCGLGGLATPTLSRLRALGTAIRAGLERRPIDEIAAVKTLRVTLAVNRPLLAPVLPKAQEPPTPGTGSETEATPNAPDDRIRPLSVARPSQDEAAALRTTPYAARYDKFFKPPTISAESSDFALAGSLLIDLDTSDGFEIEAVTAFPRTTKFDDSQRGRSTRSRKQALWPDTLASDGERRLMATLDVYGFHVAIDGTVELPRSAVTLLRVDSIKTAQVACTTKDHSGLYEIIDLEQVYGLERGDGVTYQAGTDVTTPADASLKVAPALANARVSLPHAFPDGKARHLFLRAVALSRFSHAMESAPGLDSHNLFRRGEPLPPATMSRVSQGFSNIWLDATMRPAKPVTRTPLPDFVWSPARIDGDQLPTRPPLPYVAPSSGEFRVSRRAVVHIPLQREWFSSGEGERLGIVIWPPNLFDATTGDIRQGEISIPFAPGGKSDATSRPISIPDFEDADLGPGGAFISRWGGDPIRGGGSGDGPFILPSAFGDLSAQKSTDPSTAIPAIEEYAPKLVRNVLMPVSSPDDSSGTTDMLTVSLLTYQPKFDVGNEEWYVDVDLVAARMPNPFVRLGLVRYQEHAPRELQVSQPIVEWTQLLPERVVTLTVNSDGPGMTIDVEVRGQASTHAARPSYRGDLDTKNSQPLMRLELYVEEADLEGRLTRRRLGPSTVPGADGKPVAANYADVMVEPTAEDNESVWNGEFELTAEDRARIGVGTLFIYIQEIERRRPATYKNEPLAYSDLQAKDEFVSSGPQFAVRINIESTGVAGTVSSKG